MKAIVLGFALAAAGCAAGDPLMAGTPWLCGMTPKGATSQDAFRMDLKLAKAGSMEGGMKVKAELADGLHEMEGHLEGNWRRVESGVEFNFQSVRFTRIAQNGQDAPQDELDRENAKVPNMMKGYIAGSMAITQLSKTLLKLESETATVECKAAGAGP